MITNQDAFTKMVRHLREQNEKSLLVGGGCAYRGQNGLKCAIGCLILYDEYNVSMERTPVKELYVQALHGLNFDMLESMQGLHDFREPKEWEKAFNEVAKLYTLEVPV